MIRENLTELNSRHSSISTTPHGLIETHFRMREDWGTGTTATWSKLPMWLRLQRKRRQLQSLDFPRWFDLDLAQRY